MRGYYGQLRVFDYTEQAHEKGLDSIRDVHRASIHYLL